MAYPIANKTPMAPEIEKHKTTKPPYTPGKPPGATEWRSPDARTRAFLAFEQIQALAMRAKTDIDSTAARAKIVAQLKALVGELEKA